MSTTCAQGIGRLVAAWAACAVFVGGAVAQPTPDATLEPASAPQRLGPNHYGLFIGINDYDDPTVPDLAYAEADAAALHGLLTNPAFGAIDPANATLLVGKDATFVNVRRALNDLRRIPRDSTVFVFFSGHGAKAGERAYWVLRDSELDGLGATALRDDDVREFIGRIPARRRVVLLDCCYAAATVQGSKTAAADFSGVLERFTGEGVAYLMAAGSGEEAIEAVDLRRSVFTHYTIAALAGEADRLEHGGNGDGVVALNELIGFVRDRVEDEARVRGGVQKPTVVLDVDDPDAFLLTIDAERLSEIARIESEAEARRARRLAAIEERALDGQLPIPLAREAQRLLSANPEDLDEADADRRRYFARYADGLISVAQLERGLALVESPEARAARIRGERVSTLLAEATSAANEGRDDEALALLDELLGLDPGNGQATALAKAVRDRRAEADRLERTAATIRELADKGAFAEAQRTIEALDTATREDAGVQGAITHYESRLAAHVESLREAGRDEGRSSAERRTAWEALLRLVPGDAEARSAMAALREPAPDADAADPPPLDGVREPAKTDSGVYVPAPPGGNVIAWPPKPGSDGLIDNPTYALLSRGEVGRTYVFKLVAMSSVRSSGEPFARYEERDERLLAEEQAGPAWTYTIVELTPELVRYEVTPVNLFGFAGKAEVRTATRRAARIDASLLHMRESDPAAADKPMNALLSGLVPESVGGAAGQAIRTQQRGAASYVTVLRPGSPLGVTSVTLHAPKIWGAEVRTWIVEVVEADEKKRSDAGTDPIAVADAGSVNSQSDFDRILESAQQGDADAQFQLARIWHTGRGVSRDNTKAVHWYNKAADQGHTDAQLFLGSMYDHGIGVAQDPTEAARWYRKAADQGNNTAQYLLGSAYYGGRGVGKNDIEAERWFRKAAEQGHTYAQGSLADLYNIGGTGVAQDYAEAARWYRKAAKQGYGQAQYELGRMYEKGRGVEKNLDAAIEWYRKAARSGHEPAQTRLKNLGES